MSNKKQFDLSDVNQAVWDSAFVHDKDWSVPSIDPQHKHTKDDPRIFVFGSNLLGIHGAGAAAYARNDLGAELGVGEGLTGRTYALPTCYQPGEPVTMQELAVYIDTFFEYASEHPEMRFFLSKIGCGIAGFDEDTVADLVDRLGPPSNVDIPPDWVFYRGEVD